LKNNMVKVDGFTGMYLQRNGFVKKPT